MIKLWFGRIAFVFAVLLMAAPVMGARAATLDTLYSFCSKRGCTDGTQPTAGLMRDAAGNIFGMTSTGGDVVYELSNASGKWKHTAPRLRCDGGRCANLFLTGRVIEDTAGNLYAVAGGGANGAGAVVELTVVAGKKELQVQVLYDFGQNGSGDANAPVSGLTYAGAASGLAYDGVSPLYGASAAGGAHGRGTVYELTSSGGTWSDQVLYSFCSTGGSNCIDGAQPNGRPVLDAAGNLYGTTSLFGPSGGGGDVYELSNSGGSWIQTILHAPCQLHGCKDGNPVGELTLDASGNLFGVAVGGPKRAGLIFELVPAGTSSIYSVLYDFCSVPKNCRDGVTPQGPLVLDSSGNLFGTTQYGGGHDIDDGHLGGGTVFELSGSTLTTLHAFCAESDCRDGEYPNGGIVMDASGDVFGTTNLGGRLDEGTVFELSP